MDFFSVLKNEPKDERQRNYLDFEFKYKEIAKQCGRIQFDWNLKAWYTYEDPAEFNKKFIRAQCAYESNKMKNAIDKVRTRNGNDMIARLHREKTARRIIEDRPVKTSDFFTH